MSRNSYPAGLSVVAALLALASAGAAGAATASGATTAPSAAAAAPAAKAPSVAPAPKTTTASTPAPKSTTASATKSGTASSAASKTKAPAADAKSAPSANADTQSSKGGDDTDYTLKGGDEGTAFKSLTVEGEDQVHIDFERPPLELDLNPEKAPGLEWGTARDVLDRTVPDLMAPYSANTAKQTSPYLARPWLSEFRTGAVASFRPQFEDVDRWKLIIANAKGQTVTTFSGKGSPPREITWDGRGQSGALMTPGLTYSYVFEAFDRAGNKRNFVGEGFSVNAYRIDSTEGTTLVFSAAGINVPTATRGARSTVDSNVSPLLLEAASALNESDRVSQPYKVTVTARTADRASQLAASITKALSTYVLGDPARFRPVTVVETDAPESGAVAIVPGR